MVKKYDFYLSFYLVTDDLRGSFHNFELLRLDSSFLITYFVSYYKFNLLLKYYVLTPVCLKINIFHH